MKATQHKKLHILLAAMSFVVAFILLFCASLAWFTTMTNRQADTKALSVQEPPILYVLDSDAEDILQLDMSGLKIGERKQIVFCVSSIYPVEADSHGFKGPFSLELAYTDNLSANYNLYTADIAQTAGANTLEYESQAGVTAYFTQGQLLAVTDVSPAGNTAAYGSADYSAVHSMNRARYKKFLYSESDSRPNFNLRFTESNGATGIYNTLNCRFFILDITWGDTSEVDAKETDLIYIIAKGGYAKQ